MTQSASHPKNAPKTSTNTETKRGSESSGTVSKSVSDALHSSVDGLAARMETTEKSLRELAGQYSEILSEKQKELMEQWQNSPVRKYASENPVAAAGIAFAAGALLGKLLSK